MPILDIEVVTEAGQGSSSGLAARLADAAAAVFKTPPGRTWVRLRSLPSSDYAEDAGGPPAGVRPVFVRVLKATLPASDVTAREAAALASALAGVLGWPVENVHILYEPPALGRLAFGGRLLDGSS